MRSSAGFVGAVIVALALAWYFFGTGTGKRSGRVRTGSGEDDIHLPESSGVLNVKDELFEEYLEENIKRVYV